MTAMILFTILIALVAAERVIELVVSKLLQCQCLRLVIHTIHTYAELCNWLNIRWTLDLAAAQLKVSSLL